MISLKGMEMYSGELQMIKNCLVVEFYLGRSATNGATPLIFFLNTKRYYVL